MNESDVTLTVRGAEKRDAGRGVARLPEAARRALSVLSGDTVLIEGDRTTVAKVWPAGPSAESGTVQIDADTRANAGVSIGDAVSVRKQTVEDAESVTITPPVSISAEDAESVERAIKRDLRDRPVRTGERVRIERLGVGPFSITDTDPEGTVRITDSTRVTVPADVESTESAESTGDGRISYEDIGGLDEELDLVREMIELPLSEPELFRQVGIDAPKGVLLYGPPGTGKTLIARAVANEVDASFHTVSGPEIMSKYKGESEEQLREVFEKARESSPAIVFFDEIDSVAGKRDDSGDVENRVVAQLLSLMDGLDARGDVVVIGATNRVDSLDPALRRGGRFDREIEIGVPDAVGRREIFEVHTRGMPLAEDVSLDRLAEHTYGFVGADIHALATEAGMNALRRFRTDGGTLADLTVTRTDFDSARAAVDPSAMREFVAEAPQTDFSDVGGLDDAKRTLQEAIEWPLSYTELFEKTATEPPSGVLLYGPPGTGKTLLARAIASESGVNFIHVAGPELLDRYVGESEKAVRKVFERARQAAPSIVFFDEIDALAAERGQGHEVTERVVSQLLTELDGLADNPNLVVLAATNRKEALDRALIRPGRLEAHIEVPAPDETGRRAILEIHTREKPLSEDVDLDALASELDDYTGADLAALCRAASMRAIREVASEYGPEEAIDRADEIRIRKEHFEAARAGIEPSH
ncbi:VCP-like ATPase [Halalkalicoccus paucihalophilus]|uniref:VCP-like ATPase n=1 Tax=Halalkalicoccus paucihalophilus TaxID=1008153 RepID=A0A151ADD3_9EURY|nr:CDC48 family AAA ATPase [Halalkalicoccus paucihalophilus]KYH25377.1 VCP-like ATPase [Halalkalicoccus paucihalophilus]